MRILSKLVSILSLALILSACSSIPVDHQTGVIDTNFDFGKPAKSTNKAIAIVRPTGDFTRYQNNIDINPLLAAIVQQQNRAPDQVALTYEQKVKRAFQEGFERLITSRGFTYTGPYDSFDEITYRDKKTSYLAVIPEFKITAGKANVKREKGVSHIKETGFVRVDGEFTIKLVEPMTKQVLMQKRVDLAKLKINEPYTKEWEPSTAHKDLFEMALKEAVKPDVLTDNYDKAYADAMTKFYQGSMAQLNKYISREEILDYQKDVADLKHRKTY